VTLTTTACGLRAQALTVVPRISADLRTARLELFLRFANHEHDGGARVQWTVTAPGDGAGSAPIVVMQNVGPAMRSVAANISVVLRTSDLWSPVGYGGQALWTLTAKILPGQEGPLSTTICDSKTRRFGVRRLTVAENPHLKQGWTHVKYGFIEPVCFKNMTAPGCSGWGPHEIATPVPLPANATRWQIVVNNVPVFMRGHNWIPRDQVTHIFLLLLPSLPCLALYIFVCVLLISTELRDQSTGRGVREANKTRALIKAAAFAGINWMRM
jgi:beta-galactosidase/beta-glucuronidase